MARDAALLAPIAIQYYCSGCCAAGTELVWASRRELLIVFRAEDIDGHTTVTKAGSAL